MFQRGTECMLCHSSDAAPRAQALSNALACTASPRARTSLRHPYLSAFSFAPIDVRHALQRRWHKWWSFGRVQSPWVRIASCVSAPQYPSCVPLANAQCSRQVCTLRSMRRHWRPVDGGKVETYAGRQSALSLALPRPEFRLLLFHPVPWLGDVRPKLSRQTRLV
eukprot:6194196-Pleurochrysis_carterae.AAC.8